MVQHMEAQKQDTKFFTTTTLIRKLPNENINYPMIPSARASDTYIDASRWRKNKYKKYVSITF